MQKVSIASLSPFLRRLFPRWSPLPIPNRVVKPVRKLGRTAAHRKATLSNLSTQLLVYKRIETTEAKAKETRRVVEKIITKARKGTVHAQREIFKDIRDKQAIRILFEEIVAKVGTRNGGYTFLGIINFF